MKKRFLALLLTLALVLPLLAMPAALADTPEEVRERFGLPDLEITSDTVTYLTWDSKKTMDTNLANLLMQEAYGCAIKVVRTTYAELPAKAVNMRLSGSTPDLIKYRNQEFPNLINKDVVADVTEYLDFNDPLWADLKTTADTYAYQGRYYAFPTGEMYNNNYIYYWTSYFDDMGLDTPLDLYENGEWTFSAMREMMKDLVIDDDRDGIIDTYALVLHPTYSFSISGEDFVTYDPETGLYANNLRSPALAEYFNFLYETGTAGDDTRLMSQEDISCFSAKNAAMMLGEKWVMDSNFYEDIIEGRIGVAPAPQLDGTEEHFAQGRIDVYWVGKDSANKNGALAYLACCRALAMNKDLARELAERHGQPYKEWPEEIEALIDEMNDPEKFTLLIPKYGGVGTWGDDSMGFYDLSSRITQWEEPWQTIVEAHYPLLQESINQANGAYNPQ